MAGRIIIIFTLPHIKGDPIVSPAALDVRQFASSQTMGLSPQAFSPIDENHPCVTDDGQFDNPTFL